MNNVESLAEELAWTIRSRDLDVIMGVYTALLQLRFLVRDYSIDLTEETLKSIISPSVFSRVFRENAGRVYIESMKILSDFFAKHRELTDSELRLKFIETLEVKLHDILYTTFPLYVRIDEVPETWRKLIIKIAENVYKRLYTVHDQTQAGTVAIWEGDLLRDLPSIYDLRLVEKYLLLSNIALLGYNVYLVFPIYAVSQYTLSLAETEALKSVRSLTLISRPEQILDKLLSLLKVIAPSAKIQARSNKKIDIRLGKTTSRVSLRLYLDYDNLEESRNSEGIVIAFTRSLEECPSTENIICIDTKQGLDKALLKLIAFIKKLHEELLKL